MTYFDVLIDEVGEAYRCSENESILHGMERLGKKGVPVGCRGGGCGVCKVAINSGIYKKKPMSREHISVEDEQAGVVLACRVMPLSDISLSVVGLMKKNLYKN